MPIRQERRHLYPPDWKHISARIRFVRAGRLCECRGECGISHDDMDPTEAWAGWVRRENAEPQKGRCTAVHGKGNPDTGSGVVLTVAHLNHDETDCADANLLAMCQRCHLRYDAAHHSETRRRTMESSLGLIPLEGME